MTASAAPVYWTLPAGSLLARDGAEDLPLGVDDPLRDAEHGVLLDVEDREHAVDQRVGVDGRLGDEDDVGLAVGGAQRDHAAVAAHHLDDRDPAVALGRGPDPLDAQRRDVDRRGVAGRRRS